MNHQDFCQFIAEKSDLTQAQAEQLTEAAFGLIARELSVGEAVELEDLGTFLTVKYPSHTMEDPPGSGNMVIALASIEVEFEPDEGFVKKIEKKLKNSTKNAFFDS